MIGIGEIIVSVVGKKALDAALDFFRGNKSDLQKEYDDAFQKTVDWYEKKYGDDYGAQNNRFFDFVLAEEELAKLLLLRSEPNENLISQINLSEGKNAPPHVVKAFVGKLRREMATLRECEAILVEQEKLKLSRGIKRNTDDMKDSLSTLVNLKKQELGLDGKKLKPDPTPIDWQALESMFRDEYKLDRLDYGHLATTRQELDLKLELQKVYIALNVKDRSFERIMKAAGEEKLSARQQKNLPLLFQRFDELLDVQQQKHQRAFAEGKDEDESQTRKIARKILDECKCRHLRSADTIISEIMSGQRLTREKIWPALWSLSSTAIVPRPLAGIPAKENIFLVIGDAGGGKSTASRYMALRCFDDYHNRAAKGLEREFGIAGATPLPIYLRLEDFGRLLSDASDDVQCLFNCAENFWFKNGAEKVFSAGQLYHAMKTRPVWLFLDGLDEIANPEYRRRLASVVRKLIKSNEFPLLRLMLTSRPAAITDALLNELDMPYFTVLNLEQEQITDFAHKYFAANLMDETKEKIAEQAEKLNLALEDVPAARRLATNPLLLTVIAVLHYKEGKLPQFRAELYKKCIEQLMAQKAQTMGKLETGNVSFRYPAKGKAEIDWNHNQITDMLRDLAFHAHRRTEDEIFLTEELMLERLRHSELIHPALHASNVLEEAALHFLDECDRLIGLLAFRGGHYVFVHRTFQEYLAAHWLSMQTEKDQHQQLQKMLDNPSHWREVLRLYFNRLGKANHNVGAELMELVADRAKESMDIVLIRLLAECLHDFEEYQPRFRLHDDIKQRLQNMRDAHHNKPEIFLACGDALGLMDEPDIKNDDPPLILLAPDQPFAMGGDEEEREQPVHPVRLSPFRISAYPVTNRQFAEFIRKGGYAHEKYWIDEQSPAGFDGRKFLKGLEKAQPEYWLDERFGRNRPHAPVVGVSWFEAMAYCRWCSETFGRQWAEQYGQENVQVRLPTEAEWEYACRAVNPPLKPRNRDLQGGTGDVSTPFNTGENLTTEQANYDGNYPYKDFPKGTHLRQTTSVGSYPCNDFGLFDMHGNVWEWCLDWYKKDYYSLCEKQGSVKNPRGPESGSFRVLRGGAWNNCAQDCRSANRNRLDPGRRGSNIGFRLVFVPQFTP
ncbi:MAG: SUMF1/EgtB/PvdO family nonheme iron enzyme [bacterium]